MAAAGAAEPRSELKVCVVGSGTRFVSGISYYTYFLACALKQRYDVVAILMRHLIPQALVSRSATRRPQCDGL